MPTIGAPFALTPFALRVAEYDRPARDDFLRVIFVEPKRERFILGEKSVAVFQVSFTGEAVILPGDDFARADSSSVTCDRIGLATR